MKGKHIILAVTNDLTFDRRMSRICSALADNGARVTLVGRLLKTSIPFSSPKFKGVRLKCIFNKGPLFYLEYNMRLWWYLVNAEFDVVCACDLDTALAVRLAAARKKKKSIYDAHEHFTQVPELINRPAIQQIWEWIAQKTIPGFDLRYTVGEQLASIMGEKYNSKFHVIRNIASLDQRTFKSEIDQGKSNILLYQGALNVGRGLDVCIEAIAKLPEWNFQLAGEGDITEQLKLKAKELKVEDRVQFLGWVFSEDLPALMSKAKLGINLREKGSMNDYYSLPNKFFDFIHAGLPSINMNYPEYSSVNQRYPCSLLIDEVSSDSIVKAIQFLENNPEQMEKMKEACANASLEFTWEKESAELVRLYDELIMTKQIIQQ